MGVYLNPASCCMPGPSTGSGNKMSTDKKENLHQILEKAHKACKDELSDITVSVSVVFNCYGYSITVTERTPESLKAAEVLMKNLKGKYIK